MNEHPKTPPWPFDRNFEYQDDTDAGHVHVAIKPFKPLRDERDRILWCKKAWVRLTIWDDHRTSGRNPHVNIDSDLTKLLRARVQDFPDGMCLFLLDYEKGTFKRIPSDETDDDGLWRGDIPIPHALDEVIAAGYPVKPPNP